MRSASECFTISMLKQEDVNVAIFFWAPTKFLSTTSAYDNVADSNLFTSLQQ